MKSRLGPITGVVGSSLPPAASRSRPRAIEALDEQLRRERAWLDFTVLRFLTHQRLSAVFPDYLIGVYHAMRTAGGVMEAARARSAALAPICPVAARLVPYWTDHIREEAGHDEWLLDDLRRLGVNIETALVSPPSPEVAELMGTLHFWVLHAHPVGALAYFYVVERSPPSVELLDWMVDDCGIPREALQTFYRHAKIDVAHGRELEELVDTLPLTPAHLELLSLSATTTIRQLARRLEGLILRAERAVRP